MDAMKQWNELKMNGLYLYFAYGSNLLPSRMIRRCPHALPVGPAILPNYQITERLYADVDFRHGSQVFGFLYLLRASDVVALDRYEGYPAVYKRYMAEVLMDDVMYPALVYEMTDVTKRVRNGIPYPDAYRRICRSGARIRKIKSHFSQRNKTYENN